MLKKTKSPVLKIGGYIILGFFVLIIAISFGMPDFMSRMGHDPSVVATVNGEPVQRIDFLRYRDTHFRDLASEGMEEMILNYYLGEVLLLQTADSYGFDTSEERLIREIRSEMGLDQTGGIDRKQFRQMLAQQRLSQGELAKIFRDGIIRSEFLYSIQIGTAVSRDEALTQLKLEEYEMQFRYSYISMSELRERFSNRLRITESDIEEELALDTSQLQDPETDRERIRQQIRSRRLSKIRQELVSQVNSIAEEGGPFNRAATALGGSVSTSNRFSPGEQVKDITTEESLENIVSSPIFQNEFFNLNQGNTSSAIETQAGIYIFTPVIARVPDADKHFSEEEIIAMKRQLEGRAAQNITGNMMALIQEKSKIVIHKN